MAIDVACTACGWSGRAKTALAGRRVKCPKCAASIRVGGADGQAAPAVVRQPPPPPAPLSPSPAPSPPVPAPPPAPTKAAPAESPRPAPLKPAEAAALITARIEPVRTTFSYRLALAAVAVAMILLPLAYLAMIAGVGWGVWWHLSRHTGWLFDHGLRGRAVAIPLFAYAAPAVAGAAMVLFMLKPLLARRPGAVKPESLERGGEPALFALVEHVCRAVGAPMPRRIDIDMRVNASASHRRGLLSVFGDDLVLTIGLPLVAGTTVEQFTGILAHEFGHFTQGAGLGFGAVVQRINAWFARVVWERDAWDLKLRDWSKESGLWIGGMLMLARGAVWLTRRILFGLMWIGHALSCHLSRQMEYDADLHEVRLVGSRTFADTFRRLTALAIGETAAWRTLDDAWVEGITVDSIPDLVVLGADRLSAAELAAIAAATAAETAGAFDTHPTTRDRVQRASAARAEPLLECRDPASRLFTDFPRLCRGLTLAIHEQTHAGQILAVQLRPATEILARQGLERDAIQAAARWQDEETSPALPFPGQGGALRGTADECLEALRAARAALRSTSAPPRERWEEIFAPLARHQLTFLAASFVATGRAYRNAEQGLTVRTAEEAETARQAAWHDFRQRSAPLVERRRLTDRRLGAALGWLHSPAAEARLPDAPRRRDEAAALCRALAALEARRLEWTSIIAEFDTLVFWAGQVGNGDTEEAARQAIPPALARTTAGINAVRESLLGEPYPLDHIDPTMTIGRYLVPEAVRADAPEGVFTAANRVRSLFPWLAWQLVGRLALHAEAVEGAIDGDSAPAS